MKKSIILVIIVAFLLTLANVSCKKKTEETKKT